MPRRRRLRKSGCSSGAPSDEAGRVARPHALVLLLLLLGQGAAYAQRPRARCVAVQHGRRTIARVELAHFLDGELLRLVRLGLEGRFHLEVQLFRRRFAWFDDVDSSVVQDLVLTWDAARRRYLLNGAPVEVASLDPVRL